MTVPAAGMRGMLAALLLVAGTPAALAAATEYEVRLGLTYSDNLYLLSEGFEQDATAAVAGFSIDGARETGRLRYDVMADLSQYAYLDVDAENELLGIADLSASYDLVRDVFSWNLGLGYGVGRDDAFRPLVPGNTNPQTTFSTGPTFHARFGGQAEAELEASYSRLNTESGTDSETVGGSFVVLHRRNPGSALGLGLTFDDISYSGSLAADLADYERQEVFVRVNASGTRTSFNVDGGYSEMKGRLVSDGSPVWRAQFMRRLTPALTGHIGYVREYPTSDTTLLFDDDAILADYTNFSTGPRSVSTIDAGLHWLSPRSEANLNYSLRDERSLIPFIGKHYFDGFSAGMSRDISPRARGSLFLSWTKEEFSQFAAKFDDRVVGAEFERALGRALSVSFRAEYRTRDSNISEGEYSEIGAGIYVRYGGLLGNSTAVPSDRE